jgi:hypothetical protein
MNNQYDYAYCFSWGSNSHGQLVHGIAKSVSSIVTYLENSMDSFYPKLITQDHLQCKQIKAGGGHTLILKESKVYSVGY